MSAGVTVKLAFHVRNGRRSQKELRQGEEPQVRAGRVPRVSRLMALAIPLQGAIAATMLACASQQQAPAVIHHHEHHHAGSAGHHHPVTVSQDGAAAEDPAGHADTAACSVCASCCSSSALPATPALLDEPDTVHVESVPFASAVTAFVAPVLERPPRPLSA